MNREIKFRAWDKVVKEWRTWVTVTNSLTGLNGLTNPILMQYTGLVDKNGKEIYEGDILIVKGKNYAYKFSVYWDEQSARFMQSPIDDIPDYLDWLEVMIDKIHLVEVIGNIYENPNLLKGTE